MNRFSVRGSGKMSRHVKQPSRIGGVTRGRRRHRPGIERLEDRLAPATIVWDGGFNGNGSDWGAPQNWVGDVLPDLLDDAVIPAAFSGSTISISGIVQVKSVTSSALSLGVVAGGYLVTLADSVVEN